MAGIVIQTILVYILAASVLCIESRGTNETTQLKPENRIIGGEFATPGEFPHQILVIQIIPGTGTGNLCGGSLIRAEWILTAAHCVNPGADGLNSFVIIAGRHSGAGSPVVEGEQTNAAEKVFVHPGYLGITLDIQVKNDIGLIKLAKPFTLNDRVKLVQIDEDNRAKPGTQTTAIGWGRINPMTSENAPALKKATLFLPEDGICEKLVTSIHIESQICLNETASVCSGDSGGPLLCNDGGINYVCGIASYVGDVNRCSGPFNVFGRVFYFKDWIKEIIESNSEKESFSSTESPLSLNTSKAGLAMYLQPMYGFYIGTILVPILLTQ